MGWTFTHKPQHIKARQFLRERLTSSNDAGTWTVIDDSLVHRSEYYAVMRRTFTDGKPDSHFLAVLMVKFVRDEYNIGWKDMDDSMGPNIDNVPERILDLADKLAPCTPEYDRSGYAKKWREHCRVNITKRRSAPKPGTRVRFNAPIKFTDGSVLQEFVLQKGNLMKPVYENGTIGPPYRLSKWKERDYVVTA